MRALGHLDLNFSQGLMQTQKVAIEAETRRLGHVLVGWSLIEHPEEYSATALYRRAQICRASVVITYSLPHIGYEPEVVWTFCEVVTIDPHQAWTWPWATGNTPARTFTPGPIR
jgi:hypothetical protein